MGTAQVSALTRPGQGRPSGRSWPPRRLAKPGETPVAEPAFVGRLDRNLYSIVLVDVERSGRLDSRGQRRMRNDLYDLVSSVVEYAGARLESFPVSDFGDGFRIVIPLDRIRPTHVVDMFVLGLAAGLREHRRYANESHRIRLRAALDLGLVEPHLDGWSGDPLVRVTRLIDAEPLREALRCDRELDLATVVSEPLFETTIRHGYGYIGPACFQAIRVRIKEYDAQAWMLIPRVCGLCAAA
jgi:hypothetical protein